MDNIKDNSELTGELNASSIPLLDDSKDGGPEKDIELDEKTDMKEKANEEEGEGDENKGETKGKKNKAKKEKKPKSPKGHRRTLSCVDGLSVGLNLLDRDERHINDHVNLVFEDILAEPDDTHGFDGIWSFTHAAFSGTKFWVYRILASILAIPCGLVWGLVFSILTLLNVWLITPVMKVFDLVFYIIQRVWSSVVKALLDPIFQSAGNLCGNVRVTKLTTHQEVEKNP